MYLYSIEKRKFNVYLKVYKRHLRTKIISAFFYIIDIDIENNLSFDLIP